MAINTIARITRKAFNVRETRDIKYGLRRLTFDEDKGQFDPERNPQHAMLTILDAKTLIFGADEDGTYHVAGNEE